MVRTSGLWRGGRNSRPPFPAPPPLPAHPPVFLRARRRRPNTRRAPPPTSAPAPPGHCRTLGSPSTVRRHFHSGFHHAWPSAGISMAKHTTDARRRALVCCFPILDSPEPIRQLTSLFYF